MKHLIITLLLVLFTTKVCLSEEIEGNKAKNIVMNGEVLGMTLFDDFFKEIFRETEAGYIYSVKYENEIYYCYNYNRKKWFCESFE